MLSPSGVNQLQEEQREPQVPEGTSEVSLLSSQNWLKCNLKVSGRGGFLMGTGKNGCVFPRADFVASDFFGLFHPPQFLFPERLQTLKVVLKSQTGGCVTQLLDHFVRGSKELPEPLHTGCTVQGSGREQHCSWRTRNTDLPRARGRRGAFLADHRDAEHLVVMERQQIETAQEICFAAALQERSTHLL